MGGEKDSAQAGLFLFKKQIERCFKMFRSCLHNPEHSPRGKALFKNNACFETISVLKVFSWRVRRIEILQVILLAELSLLKWRQYFCTKGHNKLLITQKILLSLLLLNRFSRF